MTWKVSKTQAGKICEGDLMYRDGRWRRVTGTLPITFADRRTLVCIQVGGVKRWYPPDAVFSIVRAKDLVDVKAPVRLRPELR